MGKTVAWMLCLLALNLPAVARAATVRDLYAAQVPIADHSAAALAAASGEALAEVLVKVSGSRDLLDRPAIAAALADARDHVQQYAYVRGAHPPGELAVLCEFDGAYVTQLVTSAGAPLWTANRPPVLLWLVADDERGRYFVNPDSAPELSAQLLAEFARRGVPVQLPLYDLTDATALSADAAWRLPGAVLREASVRYAVDHIIAGRMVLLSSGSATGDWSYLSDAGRSDRSVSAPDAATFIRDGVSMVAQEMAARYAVAPSSEGVAGLSVTVSGVSSYADYAAIVAWLEGLELIDHANVEQIHGDTISLRLLAQADAAQLATIIELNRQLVPVPPATADDKLSYRWQK
ncbi:MAG: DUF2066 domain-containing protein [Halioglobus sp.]|nr:DUF2066 domain-containing protein [Halioglobus sp.]